MNQVFVMMSFLGITAVITPGREPAMAQRDMSGYLPDAGAVEGWKPVGPSRIFVGEGLYDLINGGAVIYFEYGFKQTITQEYESNDGHSIDLQIYEMTDPSSAFGIYTYLRGAAGNDCEIGNEGIIADYYMYFWKGNFLVTLTASDSEKSVNIALSALAAEVDKMIAPTAQRPSLCNLLRLEGQEPSRVYYLEGVLALSNLYYFAAEDIFGIKQGVAGDFGDFKLIIFKYDDEKESMSWYTAARNVLQKDERFDNFKRHDNTFSIVDEHGLTVQTKVHRNYIFTYLGSSDQDPETIFYELENNLR